jgi:hypothetical protein|nr:MAG TPA: hypothetical protein [Caudoviricetes sp.]DAN61670.1 MAG TPA: hypothetical protein [Caudoviricetes sp.]DAU28588.1 MAG TPA: hypothetical protein [Caudoviricetes sp.]
MKANLLKTMSSEAREVLFSKLNPENDYICQALKKAQDAFDEKLNQAAQPYGFFGRAMIDEKSVLGEPDFFKYRRISKILADREDMLSKRKNLVLNLLGFFN